MKHLAHDSVLRRLLPLYRVVLLPAFALALLLIMWTAVIYQISQEQISARYEAVLHSQSQARTLAEHTSHVLRQTDHATQLFKLKYEETNGALRLPEFTRKNGLLDSLMPSKLELPLALLSADGRVIDSRNGYFPADMHAQAFFRSHAANADDVALAATPVVDTRTKKWQIQISRRLNDRQGEFAGVILMMIDPAYFVEDYDRLDVDSGGAVMLLSRDTGMSTARIDDQLVISDAIDFTVGGDGHGQQRDELLLKHPFDPVERIYGYADMQRFGLMAVVGNPVASAMANFTHRRAMYYGAVSVASLLVLLFVALLIQQARRLRRSTELASEAQLMLRAAADASLDAVFLLKACRMRGPKREIIDFTIADLNERGATLLGYSRDEIWGKRLFEIMPELHTHGFVAKYLDVLRTGQPLEEEFLANFLPDRDILWLQHQIVAITDGVAVTTRNITSRKEAELEMRENQFQLAAVNDALRDSEARLRTIADALPAMVAYIDSEQTYRFHNLSYAREFQRSGQIVLGQSIRATVGEERYAFLEPFISRALAGETITFEEDDTDGVTDRAFEVIYIPQMGEDGQTVIGFHVMRHDISAQKREKQRLLKLSQVDALTGLTNRAGFLQKLIDAMAACRENAGLMAVMYMDIDRFKPVNDTYGHNVGDALLKAFSGRLSHSVRASDTVARLGGDEFTIIMDRISRIDDAAALAAKIVAAMQAPFDLDGKMVSISTSIGLTYYRDEDISPAELLNRADMLLYEAKQAGRNTFRAGTGLPPAASNAA